MHPLAYQNVFSADHIYWYPLVGYGLCALYAALATALIVLFVRRKGPFKSMTGTKQNISFIAVHLGLLAIFIGSGAAATKFMESEPWDTKVANMNANLSQKYDATLAYPDSQDLSDNVITEPNKYRLSLSDGTKQWVYLKWDRSTSEPYMVSSQNPS